jgi:hypothetical protein
LIARPESPAKIAKRQGLRLTETPFIFFMLAGLSLLYRSQVLLASTAFLLANLIRPSLDLVYPVIFVLSALTSGNDRPWLEAVRRLIVFDLVYVVLMSPWWLHNYGKFGRFVRLDLADGPTMLIENNEVFERVGLDYTRLIFWPPFEKHADPIDRNDAMKRAAIDYIAKHPLTWLKNSIKRLGRFLLPFEPNFSPFEKIEAGIVLYFSLLAAVAGLFRGPRRAHFPLWIVIGFLTAVHCVFHAVPLYRIPLDPLIIILGSAELAVWIKTVRAKIAKSVTNFSA